MIDEPAVKIRFIRAIRRFLDRGPEIHAAGEGFLVRRDDADALVEEGRVRVGDVLAAGVVDEDALVWEFGEEFERLGDGEGGRGGCVEVLRPGGEGEGRGAVGGAEAFGREGDEDEGDVGIFGCEGRELGEEVSAYTAGSWDMLGYVKGSGF